MYNKKKIGFALLLAFASCVTHQKSSSSGKETNTNKFQAGLDGITFISQGEKIIGGFYKASGTTPRPTAILIHGLPGIEKHLDIAYSLRDKGWNCLYFHFRGSWGSGGKFTVEGTTKDTRAAIDWVMQQACVDTTRVVLIGASTGSYSALRCGADIPQVKAIVGISPLIKPSAFHFPLPMASTFANMLNGITGEELVQQWNELKSLDAAIHNYLPRPLLLISAGEDDIFPASDYADIISNNPKITWIDREGSDHGFSTSRPWLTSTVTNWLNKTVGN